MSRAALRIAAAAIVALPFVALLEAPAVAAESTSTATALLDQLVDATENSAGYDRDLFPHWIDADSDGCNTRQEVLIRQSLTPVAFSSGCTVVSGTWTSPFDGATWTDPGDVDIDHLVPLAEAWRSGAYAWSTDTRRAYANDLDLVVALAAVTDEVNSAKGDKDPADWMPTLDPCAYVVDWITVKWKWGLTVDVAERVAIASALQADGCGDVVVSRPTRVISATPSGPVVFADLAQMTFATEVTWLADRGVTQGWATGDGRRSFRPLDPIMRDQMAAFLYRLAGSPSYTPPVVSPFSDVSTGYVFYKEIAWLAEEGVSQGWAEADGSRTYRPFLPVSRDVMAAFLYRFDDASFSPPSRSLFADIAPGTPFYTEMSWLASEGISTGWAVANGSYIYRPYGSVTREQMAAFMYRMINGGLPPITPTDPGPPTPTNPPNPGDTKNCGDFATWRQAQDWFEYYRPYYGDIARLDGNNDGVACESLPGAPK